jgi:plastocyanin
VLAFALLVIYGLSRIYLEIRGDGATALAAGISLGVLAVAFYFANNPRAPGWQIAGVFILVGAVLAGGTIWAVSEEDDTAAEEPAASATPSGESPNGSPAPTGGASGTLAVTMTDNKFDPAEFTVRAGDDVTFELSNEGVAIHNMRIAGEDGTYNTNDDTQSDPNLITGGGSATLEWTAPDAAGEIIFQCDFHPTDMKGTITVE